VERARDCIRTILNTLALLLTDKPKTGICNFINVWYFRFYGDETQYDQKAEEKTE
jgi:hypothetical protein